MLNNLFEYRLDGFTADGKCVGEFIASGVKPKFYGKLRLVAGDAVDGLLAKGPA